MKPPALAERTAPARSIVPQLSAAVVAFTIEADNEAERRIAHHTTSSAGPRGSVWLTSLAMWFNCLRGLDDAGAASPSMRTSSPKLELTVAELERRVRMSTNLDGMRRWGYITIDGVGRVRRGDPKPRPKRQSVLALTGRGRDAAEVWRPLPDQIEDRWRERFGAGAVDRLRAALVAIAARVDLALPDFLPIGSAYGVGLSRAPAGGATMQVKPRPGPGDDDAELPLISLLSRVLLAFALDYEDGAEPALAVHLNCLRVLSDSGIPQRELPARTGISKEAISVLLSQLQRTGCVEIGPLGGGARGKQVRLTADRGVRAAAAGQLRLQQILDAWRERFGADAVAQLSAALDPIAGDGTRPGSPLFAGLEPYEDGWRAQLPQPDLLPWFPMVSHRGGYPDGS